MIAVVDEMQSSKTWMYSVMNFYDIDGYGQMAVRKNTEFDKFMFDLASTGKLSPSTVDQYSASDAADA